MKNKIKNTDLIINPDGSVYHLHLKPGDVAETIVLVGDPGRVRMVSDCFDEVVLKKNHREFITHTGWLNNKKITAISTGIGTDNIELVMLELDAIFNIDFEKLEEKDDPVVLDFIRMGTSGAIQTNIPTGSIVIAEYAIGVESIFGFYRWPENNEMNEMADAFKNHCGFQTSCYAFKAPGNIILKFQDYPVGTTLTLPGFYAPQGRQLRYKLAFNNALEKYRSFEFGQLDLTNLEMETAAIYAFAGLLGHNAISFNAILANRITDEFHPTPDEFVKKMIRELLKKITQSV